MLTIGDFARLGGISPRMLRHYDQLGLLRPARVDPATGYRWYRVSQLVQLHRLLAFRDLGFTLDQISDLLDDELPLEALRGMLRLRRVQIEADVDEERARLRRVEAHLRGLEGNHVMVDIITKTAEPLRIAEASELAPGFGHENLGPVFERLLPEVAAAIGRAGATPGMCVAWYEEPNDDGSLTVHGGFAIADQAMDGDERIRVVDLPAIEVASAVHKGSMESIGVTYEALVSWIEQSGRQLSGLSRELYHEWNRDDPALCVTELQLPISS